MNLYAVYLRSLAQAKMNPRIIRRSEAAAANYIAALANSTRRNVHSRSDRIPRTPASADQLHPDPVIFVRIHVSKQDRHVIDLVDDDINLPVVEQVPEPSAAGGEELG
jgi:hypothetical protein